MAEEIVKNPEDLGSKFWNLKNEELFCDASLKVNGKRVPVHALVLSSSSEYFKNAFADKNNTQNEIIFEDVNEETFLSLIEYFYKGSIKLTEKNAMDVFKYAKDFNLPLLVEKSSKMMLRVLNIGNSISIFKTVKEWNIETQKNIVLQFIEKNFVEVFHTPEFLTLDYSDFKELLNLEMKYVSKMNIYEAIKLWIKHDSLRNENMIDLLNQVKLECLPEKFLLSESETMCNGNAECMLLFLKALTIQKSSIESDCLDFKNTLVVIGGETPEMSKTMDIFDIVKGNWTEINYDFKRVQFNAVFLNKEIMIIGGDDDACNKAEYYNVESAQVETLPSMKYNLIRRSAVKLNDFVYVVGGSEGKWKPLPHVERWSINSKTWSEVAPMKISRHSVATVVLGEKIYAIGGSSKKWIMDVLSEVEVYNPIDNTWKMCKPMKEKRYAPAVAVLGGFIYVVGGYNFDKDLKTAEKYDPSADTWTMIESIEVARDKLASGILNGQLVIIGGQTFGDGISTVEVYDIENKKWKPMASLSRGRCYHRVLEVPWTQAMIMLNKK